MGEQRTSAGRRRPMLLRYVAVALATLVLLWLSVAVSLAGALRETRPDVALRFWPGDGPAKAMLADIRLQQSIRSPRHDEERDLARDALASEPTSARAARIVAMLSGSESEVARRFAYARQLSRRDLLVNLWFIEEAVQRNDVPGALRQYDTTLRTSTQAPRVLFPILSSAMAQRDLAGPIARLLATGGEWVPDFFDAVLAEQAPAADLGRVVLRQPQVLGRLNAATQARLIGKLADERQFEIGGRIYRAVSGRQPMMPGIGSPVSGGEWPPFDWLVIDTGNYGAASSAGDGPLQVYAQGGTRGTVARRLIQLGPGAYRMTAFGAVSQGDPSSRAVWSLSCAQRDADPIAALPIAGGPGQRQTRLASFRIGPACTWHWINLILETQSDADRFEAVIDRVRIDRVSE